MIEAGEKSHIILGDGTWIFVDIGFAQKRTRSCGVLVGESAPCCLSFGEARARIGDELKARSPLVNLVIEAPLSVCFDMLGNPKGRKIEDSSNYWYLSAGCVVMVATTYFLHDIYNIAGRVRLFEGFISNRARRHPHKEVVELLRDVVRNPQAFPGSIYDHKELADRTDVLSSAFSVAGFDCGIPTVIKPEFS